VLRPTSDWGERLAGRLQAAFVRRFPHVLADALSRLEPSVALAALGGSLVPEVQPEMAPDDWNVLLACAFGPAQHDATVQPAWELVRGYLSESKPRVELEPVQRILLLTRVIQHRPWAEAAACCGIDDVNEARRRLRLALQPLILAYGPTWARRSAERYDTGDSK
jgi:tRNA(Met) C34 N-acetyltransferase TmcA